MAFSIQEGNSYKPGQFYEGVLDDFQCYFGEVPESLFDEYVGQAQRYYKETPFPLLQCVCPTTSGVFLWEENFSKDLKSRILLLVAPPVETQQTAPPIR